MTLFTKTQDHEYVCSVWFERDRAYIGLETPKGKSIFDLWDEEVWEAIEDGFLTTPRLPRPTEAQWQPHAVAYAYSQGLL